MAPLKVNSNIDRLSITSSQHMPGEYSQDGNPVSPNTSTQLSLAQAVHARRAEYSTPRTIHIKVGTWNVAAFKGTENDLGGWFIDGKGVSQTLTGGRASSVLDKDRTNVEDPGHQEEKHSRAEPTLPRNDQGVVPGGDDIGIYALGLQEVVDINSAVEALRPFSDVAAPNRFKAAMEEALPQGYKLVVEQQLIGLLLLVYASPDVAPEVHSISTTSVGTGLMGYMGNKGAVTARIVVGETTRLLFVNCHLSAGSSKQDLERRNWDVAQILGRTRFDPIMDGLGIVHQQGERIGDEDFAFWFGDLNYRLEGVPGEDVRRLLMMHTRNEYDSGQKSERKITKELAAISSRLSASFDKSPLANRFSSSLGDDSNKEPASKGADSPSSLQMTLDSLLPHDELHQAQKAGKAFQEGWREGEICFLPTYKYDAGTVGVFDTGEKKRGPSWCDRILYRSRADRVAYEERMHVLEEAKKRDAEMRSQGLDTAAESESTMFEYDPDADGDDEYDENEQPSEAASNTVTAAHTEENLVLKYYTSHQRVLSADHKPLNALFSLTFDATDRDAKTRIQQEVARELDRIENEGRPLVTIIVDGASQGDNANFNGISFGHVRYDEPKSQSVTVANTGRVTAMFGFVSRPEHSDAGSGSSTARKWLSINVDIPSDKAFDGKTKKDEDEWDHEIDKVFTLEPGETGNVELASYVKDKEALKMFNDGETMEDILVLRVKDGRDHFLPVRAIWHASVHGRTLDRLIRIPEGGVRALQSQRPADSKSRDQSANRSQAVMWSAPREIFRLTDAIENLIERIVAEWSMLGVSDGRPPWAAFAGWPWVEESWTLDPDTRQQMRVDVNEALDTDQELNATVSPSSPPLHRLEVLVDVLLDFLKNLEDGIITAGLWSKLEEKTFNKTRNNGNREGAKASVMEVISEAQAHSISFILLTSMLARTSQEIAQTFAAGPKTPSSPVRTSLDLPASPKVKVHRKTLDQDPVTASKQLVLANVVAVFADVLVRTAAPAQWLPSQAHRRELISLFLDGSIG